MHIRRQPVCQHTKERGNASIRQEMKIVHKDIAGFFSRQLMAEIIHQQSAAGGIRGAGIVPQKVKPARAKASCTLFQRIARLSEYTLMRMICNASVLARSARYQLTAVVFP